MREEKPLQATIELMTSLFMSDVYACVRAGIYINYMIGRAERYNEREVKIFNKHIVYFTENEEKRSETQGCTVHIVIYKEAA